MLKKLYDFVVLIGSKFILLLFEKICSFVLEDHRLLKFLFTVHLPALFGSFKGLEADLVFESLGVICGNTIAALTKTRSNHDLGDLFLLHFLNSKFNATRDPTFSAFAQEKIQLSLLKDSLAATTCDFNTHISTILKKPDVCVATMFEIFIFCPKIQL